MLGSDDPPSATPASSATTSLIEKSSTVDPLQMILQRLDSMQGRLVALEKDSTSVSSNEVNVAEATPVTEEANRKKKTSLNTFAVVFSIFPSVWNRVGSDFSGRVPGYSLRWAIIGDNTKNLHIYKL